MNPQVYEFVLQGTAAPLVDIYAPVLALKSAWLYFGAAGLSAAALLLVSYREGRHLPTAVAGSRPWLPASLMLSAMYVLTWENIDEVSVNLEHAYNLHHFGRFSFSPARMVDGTVEYAYYLLLAPFAFSATALVAANFILGLLIAFGHLWLISRLIKDARPSTQLGLLLLFAVNYPLVAVFSNGFGNSLVSLGCLASLSQYFSGKAVSAAIVASALPLLRPDAVLYSYALLFAYTAASALDWSWRAISRWAWPAVALAIYLLVFRMAYGHWVPTPIAFKSVHPSMVTFDAIKSAWAELPLAVASWPQALVLVAAAASFWVRGDARIGVLRWLLLPTTAVLCFYTLTHNVLGDHADDAYARYWVGFTLALVVCGLLTVARAASLMPVGWQQRVFGFLVPVAVILLTADAVGWDRSRNAWRNRTSMAYAGQITEAVTADGLVLSTSELATYGLMIDREIVDLWGYTNPEIAQSRLLNEERIRNNPAFFLSARPDLYFAYLEPADVSGLERDLAEFHHMRKEVNILGDMPAVFAAYDVVVVRHPQRSVLFLVRREAVPRLRQSLEAHSYAASSQRALDLERFLSTYRTQNLVQHRF